MMALCSLITDLFTYIFNFIVVISRRNRENIHLVKFVKMFVLF